MRRVFRNTACILSSWWRVFGSPRSSTSSSRSQPSTVVFLAVFHGRSPGSGSALTRYFMGMNPISPPAQSLNWRFISWSLPCRANLGLVSLVFSSQTLSSCPRSHETVRFGAVSPGVCGPCCRMCPHSHGSLSRVNHLEHTGRDQPGGHLRVAVVVGGEAQLPRRRLPRPVGRVPPGREVLHRDKALIRQRRLDEPRDALEDHEVPGGLVEFSHCVRVRVGNLLWWRHQLIRRRRHGVGGRGFRFQERREVPT